MLLRRVIQHVKDQNWFAVFLDFVIVVVGVFVGIQVANWNDARLEKLSEVQYLERFAEEIELTIAHIREERRFSERSIGTIENFTSQLFRNVVSDEDIISTTDAYFSEGAFFARFNPNRTTFDDLITTGNFDVISDEAIRTGLIKLHALYDESKTVLEGNIDWLQQGEPLIYYEFDAFRFDARTSALFDDVMPESLSADVRRNRDLLRRHASSHYWIKVRSVELYDLVEPQALEVLNLIHAELEHR